MNDVVLTEKNGFFSNLFTGNMLKLIALVSMTVDHIGFYFFPENMIFRYVGRVAFPLFAYFIAEGCKYTKNRKKHLVTMTIVGVICQVVYTLATGSLYMNIFITFVLSVSLIYLFDNAKKSSSKVKMLLALAFLVVVVFVCEFLPGIIASTGFNIDYGIIGVMLPVLIYNMKTKRGKLIVTAGALLLLTLTNGLWHIFNLCSLPLLYFYNGKKGKAKLKYLFYIYYPLHLVIIFLINLFIVK